MIKTKDQHFPPRLKAEEDRIIEGIIPPSSNTYYMDGSVDPFTVRDITTSIIITSFQAEVVAQGMATLCNWQISSMDRELVSDHFTILTEYAVGSSITHKAFYIRNMKDFRS